MAASKPKRKGIKQNPIPAPDPSNIFMVQMTLTVNVQLPVKADTAKEAISIVNGKALQHLVVPNDDVTIIGGNIHGMDAIIAIGQSFKG